LAGAFGGGSRSFAPVAAVAAVAADTKPPPAMPVSANAADTNHMDFFIAPPHGPA
jgi:hypothetical protein